MSKHDPVNHPIHYTSHPSGIECIEITRHMNFNCGNTVKYVWRHGLKPADPNDGPGIEDAILDLQKAIWYLRDEIDRLTVMLGSDVPSAPELPEEPVGYEYEPAVPMPGSAPLPKSEYKHMTSEDYAAMRAGLLPR